MTDGGPFGVDGEVWRLENASGELVCDVVVDEAEDFALHGRLRPGPAYREARPWFAAEVDADRADDDAGRREAQDRLNERFVLRDPRGGAAELFSFFVRGDRVGFRWVPWWTQRRSGPSARTRARDRGA